MPIFDRRSMDESQHELSSEGVPERDDVAALSIENRGSLTPGVELNAVEAAGSLTGTTIGHYLVGERLGGGAMAAVYRAHDQILDRSVAIKVLLPGADSVMQARFRREARTVSGLVHPHIVRTLQVGRSGGIIYIAMELVEGVSLGDLLERHGKLSVADAARILAPVAEALAYAHEKGIIHRDVKPSNILLQRTNPGAADSVVTSVLPYPVIPLLSDFGIARALDAPELTNAGRTIGTPAFMAPEQCAGSAEIDGRADVYALGAVLYRCLVGRPPFAGSTTQILHAHVYDPLLIPDVVADSLPAPVVRLMARAMMKEPSQRFASVDLMALELQSVADLPVLPVLDASTELADPTMTMASLPVAQSPATSTSRILVPAAAVVPVRTTPLKPTPRVTPPGTATTRAIPVAPLPTARPRSRRSQWGMIALGGAFVVLVILLAATLINSLLPGGDDDLQGVNSTPTAAVVAGDSTPQLVTPVPDLSPVAAGNDVTPDASSEPAGANSRPTPTPTPTGPTPTPTPLPTPAVDLSYAWKQAQAFYAEGDWEEARSWLKLVDRKLDGTDAPSEAELEISEQRVNEMLVASFVGLATDAATTGIWKDALAFLDDALKIAPNDTVVIRLRDAFDGLAKLTDSTETTVNDQRTTLYDAIAVILAEYADRFEAGGKVCDALFQVNNAINIAVSKELQDRKTALTTSCEREKATDAIAETGGTILYSSQDGSYNIYRLEIAPDSLEAMQSSLVIQNGAQPRLSPGGTLLAYHNPAEGGLWAVTMGDGLVPYGGAQRYSSAAEDSRDGPPTWNARGTQVAYGRGNSNSNSPSHVFVTSADTNTDATDLRDGKDPAWHPSQDLLVFNGPDIDGSNPGLHVMTLGQGGNDRRPLTQNGNDLRPTWTPDGDFIVFMSKDRGNLGDNWELYKYKYETGEITQLTDGNPAQDGLPAISPDGKWVAFMSDRGGRWNLWYVSMDGGPVIFLSEIAGQPVAWLEHAVQWVR